MTTKDEALKLALGYLDRLVRGLGLDADSEAVEVVRAIREALASEANHAPTEREQSRGEATLAPSGEQQEPVAWQILNGVCHAGIRSTEDLAKEAAAGMQKTHDLAGSLAAFHVRPLYTSPQPAQPSQRSVKPWRGLTDEAVWSLYKNLWMFHPAEEPRLAADILKFARAIEAKLKEKNGF